MTRERKLDKHVKKYIERELRNYHKLEKEYQELREEIIFSVPSLDGQPRGKSISKTTENKAFSLRTNARLQQLEKVIAAISKVIERLPDEKKEFVRCKYWSDEFTREGLAVKFHIDVSNVWRWADVILEQIAAEMGIK